MTGFKHERNEVIGVFLESQSTIPMPAHPLHALLLWEDYAF